MTVCIQVMKESPSELKQRPENGCYIWGLFLEGARWDVEMFELSESKPKELYTDMPVMWLIPTANRKQPETGMYLCPVYKTLTRAGKDYVVYCILSAYRQVMVWWILVGGIGIGMHTLIRLTHWTAFLTVSIS